MNGSPKLYEKVSRKHWECGQLTCFYSKNYHKDNCKKNTLNIVSFISNTLFPLCNGKRARRPRNVHSRTACRLTPTNLLYTVYPQNSRYLDEKLVFTHFVRDFLFFRGFDALFQNFRKNAVHIRKGDFISLLLRIVERKKSVKNFIQILRAAYPARK